MPLGDLLPFLGIRKLFDPSAYSGNVIMDGPGTGGFGGNMPQSGGLAPSIGQAPDAQPDNINQLTQILLDRINKPDQNLDRLSSLYNEFPTKTKPSVLRRIGAGLVGMGYGPEEARKFLEAPHQQDLADWATKAKTAESIAGLDIKGQQSDMSNAVRGIGALVANERTQNANDIALQKIQNDVVKTTNALKVAEDKLAAQRDNQKLQEEYHNAALANTKAIADLRYESLRATTEARLAAAQTAANQKAWTTAEINDPSDPTGTKKITVSINPITGKAQRIKLDEEQVTGAEKLGTPPKPTSTNDPNALTTSTKTMMEGARTLLPHIAELRAQAADLDKRGLFGFAASRVRNLGSKIGTVGDPGTVQKNLENFASGLNNDSELNKSGDSVVGQFATTLGLMASGAGRVHGGARGGGSIQMVNYMKQLLSDNSSLAMFNGRLNALESYLKTYAAGPPKLTPANKTELDKVIDDILSGAKK